jgi:broad specificity phosphatase PhoE
VRLLLVRHGETDANKDGIALGRLDVPLNDTGLAQAKALGVALAAEPIAAIHASPLTRALTTAEAIAGHHTVGVTIEPGLIEMDVGEIDGTPFPEVRERYPEFLAMWMSEDGPGHPMPGGESLVAVAERAWATVNRLSRRHEGETVVVVSHNFVILTLLARVMDVELHNFRRLRHAVAAISELDMRPGRARVLRLNDTCHLQP